MAGTRTQKSRRKRSSRARRPAANGRATAIVGVDTGGTFTDIVYRVGRRTGTLKVLSTPDDPARAVLDGLAELFETQPIERLTYGTTVATNAMLERRGHPTALVTTEGFEDVIEIGRQARPDLYDLEPVRAEPLVPASLRFGLAERVLADGSVEQRPSLAALRELARRLRRSRVESIAVCLLHAHVNGDHERRVARALRALGMPISLSHELSPAAGEYERASTTVANAYVRPLVADHLSGLARRSRAQRFRVMQSNGGSIGVVVACREPIRTMLSGPAGGVTAAAERAAESGFERAITLDMGGTSTDVALIDRTVVRRPDTLVGEIPVRTPCIDIHTVGAGGGSIAALDVGGSLKVGPASAGADPGPACYGRGDAPTVTDANVVLGRLRADDFLGGAMTLDAERARRALVPLARAMRVAAIEQAAEGIVRVVEGTMEHAIRVITVERGQDPRTCVLVAFGGAAGLHACGLAEALGITDILVPADPGLLSAWGVIDGPVVRDRTLALRRTSPELEWLAARARALERTARAEVAAEGVAAADVSSEVHVRARYLGQSIELEVPLARGYRRTFDREHQRRFHTSSAERPIEVIGLRATASGAARARRRARRRGRKHAAASAGTPRVFVAGRWRPTPMYRRAQLAPGAELTGPAVLTEYSSTMLVAPGWRARIDEHLALRLERGRSRRSSERG